MRLIDPTKTNSRTWGVAETGETSPSGSVTLTEHWDGSVDATVRPQPIRMVVTNGAPPRARVVAAIAELEAATREARLAKHSGSAEWSRYATKRLKNAAAQLEEVM